MDPNTTLQDIRAAISSLDNDGTSYDPYVDDLVTSVEALDAWLSSGGFLPEAWDPDADPPPAPKTTATITLQIAFDPDLHEHPKDWHWATILDVLYDDVKVLDSHDEANNA